MEQNILIYKEGKNENLNIGNLNGTDYYYNKEEGNIFMKKINKLNMNFSVMTEKYIKTKSILDKINDNLFLNLFKQISTYIEEIEKLNLKMKERGNNLKIDKSNIQELNKELIYSKRTVKHLEKKLNEKERNEIKLKKEIESYKRQIVFYKDKIKIDILNNSIRKNIDKSYRSSSVRKTRTSTEENNSPQYNLKKTFLKSSKSFINKKIKEAKEDEKESNNYQIFNTEEEPIMKRLTVKRKVYKKRNKDNNNINEYINFYNTERKENKINKSKSSINYINKFNNDKYFRTDQFNPLIMLENSNVNVEKEEINIDEIYKILKNTNSEFDNDIQLLKSQEIQIKYLMDLISKKNNNLNDEIEQNDFETILENIENDKINNEKNENDFNLKLDDINEDLFNKI
jgi:hypothetical protein